MSWLLSDCPFSYGTWLSTIIYLTYLVVSIGPGHPVWFSLQMSVGTPIMAWILDHVYIVLAVIACQKIGDSALASRLATAWYRLRHGHAQPVAPGRNR